MRARRDVIAGLVFAVIGVLFLALSFNYSMGSVGRMGPGWFPAAVATLLVIVGAAMVAKGLASSNAGHVSFSQRDVAAAGLVCGSLVAFGIVLPKLGLLPATLILVGLAMLARRVRSRSEYIVLPLALAAGVAILFGLILNLPVPILAAGGR